LKTFILLLLLAQDRQPVKYPIDYMTGQILSPVKRPLFMTGQTSGAVSARYLTGHRLEQPAGTYKQWGL